MTTDNDRLFRQRGPTTYIEDIDMIVFALKESVRSPPQGFSPSLCEYVCVYSIGAMMLQTVDVDGF